MEKSFRFALRTFIMKKRKRNTQASVLNLYPLYVLGNRNLEGIIRLSDYGGAKGNRVISTEVIF
jgi:hypothetical protein